MQKNGIKSNKYIPNLIQRTETLKILFLLKI